MDLDREAAVGAGARALEAHQLHLAPRRFDALAVLAQGQRVGPPVRVSSGLARHQPHLGIDQKASLVLGTVVGFVEVDAGLARQPAVGSWTGGNSCGPPSSRSKAMGTPADVPTKWPHQLKKRFDRTLAAECPTAHFEAGPGAGNRVDRHRHAGRGVDPRFRRANLGGLLYLAVLLDAHSRRVVGWAIADQPRAELALATLAWPWGAGGRRRGSSTTQGAAASTPPRRISRFSTPAASPS